MTTTRKVRRGLGVPTRDASSVRRAPLAPAIVSPSIVDDDDVARLLSMRWAVAANEAKPRAVRDLVYRLRTEGKGATVDLSHHVKGTWLDRLAPSLAGDTRRGLALSTARDFLRLVREHGLTSSTAIRHALRAAAHGVLADHYVGQLMSGAADDDARKLAATLTTSARTEVMTALAIEAQARTAREATGGWDAETLARFEHIVGGDSRGGSTGELPPMPPDADRASTRPPHASDSPHPGLPSDPEPDSPPQPGLRSHGGDA